MKPLAISNQFTTRESPSLAKYLNDVARIPLITVEEEVDLAARIKLGDTVALDKLISANLRFVVSVAKQYQFRGLNLHDLINEGNLGLVKAAAKFDETRGFKFISYAVWWIRQGIIQALAEKSRIVRLPLNKINVINKINKASLHFEQIHQRSPTAVEMSELIDFSSTEIELCIKHSYWAVSMDEPSKFGDSTLNMHNTIGSDSSSSPEKNLIKGSLEEEIQEILNILPSREAYIIKMYFGIGTFVPLTLDEIGHNLKLTKERTRQLKSAALIRLRRSSGSEILKDYLD